MEMEDDSDDSSAPVTLEQFREKWQHELNITKRCHSGIDNAQCSTTGGEDSKTADHQVHFLLNCHFAK